MPHAITQMDPTSAHVILDMAEMALFALVGKRKQTSISIMQNKRINVKIINLQFR